MNFDGNCSSTEDCSFDGANCEEQNDGRSVCKCEAPMARTISGCKDKHFFEIRRDLLSLFVYLFLRFCMLVMLQVVSKVVIITQHARI